MSKLGEWLSHAEESIRESLRPPWQKEPPAPHLWMGPSGMYSINTCTGTKVHVTEFDEETGLPRGVCDTCNSPMHWDGRWYNVRPAEDEPAV